MLTIRRFESRDFDAVVGMEMLKYGSRYATSVFIRQMQVLAGSTFFISEVDGEITGYTIGSIIQMRPEAAWIIRLHVRDDHRRIGIGRQLVKQVIHQFQEMGVSEIFLSVSPGNQIALSLYLSHGFSTDAYEEAYFGPGEDRWILKMAISGRGAAGGAGENP